MFEKNEKKSCGSILFYFLYSLSIAMYNKEFETKEN